jgi:hypothetical protein
MGSREMMPDEAARLLDAEFRPYPWYLSVGVGNTADGQPLLFVYTKSGRHRELAKLSSGWMGYKVIVRAIGSIRPINRRAKYAALG